MKIFADRRLPLGPARWRFRRRVVPLVAIASATAGCSAPAAVMASQAAPAAEPIVIRSGPHWRGGIITEVSETFTCRGGERVTATFGFIWPADGTLRNRRRQLLALRYDGRAVDQETVTRVDTAMQEFPTEPMFSPQCFRGRLQVQVYQQEPGRPIRETFIEVPIPAD